MGNVKQNAIPYTKERCLKAAISELVDDYETIKRDVVELREHNKYLEMRVSEESDYAELESRHNALVDAVKKMLYADKPGVWDAQAFKAARAEVYRLIADCKWEG